MSDDVEALAEMLRKEAERARTSPDGQHPEIPVMTHAAALRWAADFVAARAALTETEARP